MPKVCPELGRVDMSSKRNECNDRTGGRPMLEDRPGELEWLRNWNWKYWVTFTFSRDLGPDEANAILNDYLNEMEAAYHDCLTCMIGLEQKTLSGSGKPSGRVHFHLLIGSAVDISPNVLKNWWQLPKFGGSRTAGAGADVRIYDPRRGAISYLLKFRADPAWDVRYRNLELLSPLTPISAETSSKMRRKLQRCEERRTRATAKPICLRQSAPSWNDLAPVPFKRTPGGCRGSLAQQSVYPSLRVFSKAGIEVPL